MTNHIAASVPLLLNDSGVLVGYVDTNGIERNMSGIPLSSPYSSQNTGIIPIAQNEIPSRQLSTANGTTAAQATLMDCININLPGPITPGTELLVSVSWQCTSSANNKTLQVFFGDIGSQSQLLFSDVETTNVSNELLFRITFSGGNSATAQLISASKTPGSATSTAYTSKTFSLSYPGVPGQPLTLQFWGTLANLADTMQVMRHSVWLNYAPAYPSNRGLYGQKVFWGGNAHFDDIVQGGGGITTAQVVSCMNAMNMTLLRMGYESAQTSNFNYATDTGLKALAAMATALQGTGKQMYCLIDLDLTSDGTHLFTTESAAYLYGYTVGAYVAGVLYPLGVNIFECGNELDTKNNMGTSGGGTWGYYPYQFNNAQWPIFRGVISGCIDGVHSVKGALAASNAFTVASVGAMYNLWNGWAPDGSTGYKKVRWDISAFHNYEVYGWLTGMQTYVSGPYVNIYQYLKENFGVPIIISEMNGSGTDAQNAAYCTAQLTEAFNLRYKYNIMAMIVYQLFQGEPYGMILTPSTATLTNPQGTTVSGVMGSLVDTGV